jgi:hypothetical protein
MWPIRRRGPTAMWPIRRRRPTAQSVPAVALVRAAA